MNVITVSNLFKSYTMSSGVRLIFELLSLRNNDLNHDRVIALDNINFEVKKGEAFGIIGSNGSGKSTLLQKQVSCLNK